VRRALAPLARLAEKAGAAGVVVGHLNKTSGGYVLEPSSALQQALTVEIAHAVTLAGRGLLIEAMPVPGAYAAH